MKTQTWEQIDVITGPTARSYQAFRLCLPALFSGYWQTFTTFESQLTSVKVGDEAQRNGRVDKFMANE